MKTVKLPKRKMQMQAHKVSMSCARTTFLPVVGRRSSRNMIKYCKCQKLWKAHWGPPQEVGVWSRAQAYRFRFQFLGAAAYAHNRISLDVEKCNGHTFETQCNSLGASSCLFWPEQSCKKQRKCHQKKDNLVWAGIFINKKQVLPTRNVLY